MLPSYSTARSVRCLGGLLCGLALTTTACWSQPPAQAARVSRPAYVMGTVVESRSYEVRANFRGRPKRIFPQPGQLVRRGEILVKGWDHNFAVAPADAIVLRLLATNSDYLQPAAPVVLLAAVQPFRLALPLTAAAPAIGQLLRLQGPDGSSAATAVVVGSSAASGQRLLELRLRSLGPGPLPTGTAVRVEVLPPAVLTAKK
jgi:hypothetical protein